VIILLINTYEIIYYQSLIKMVEYIIIMN